LLNERSRPRKSCAVSGYDREDPSRGFGSGKKFTKFLFDGQRRLEDRCE
jgi:hypothetical protein